MSAAATLAGRLGLDLRDPSLLHQALVHSSYLHEHPDAATTHNERLEFLGDAVVNLAISQAVYLAPSGGRRRAPLGASGGDRVHRRPGQAGRPHLARRRAPPRRGRGEPRRPAPAIPARVGVRGGLAGALYLELGYEATRDWLLALAAPELERITSIANLKSPKSRLQERTQQTTGERPHYRVVDASGPGPREDLQDRGGGQRPRPRLGRRSVAADRRDRGRRAGPRGTGRRGRLVTRLQPRGRRAVSGALSAPPRLLGLRLHGFKSFAERTVVEFGGGISAIVGPNGSGKSNLADALRWALGEQGRSLRTRKSEDVIFAGSERRAAIGMADVTLILDNADGLLPVDYRVLEIGRRLYRSGENDYLLNKGRVRLRDLVDLLDAAHLADNAFLFIGQGMVDQALALRPDERRPLFEEVAGVRRHERRRRRAEDQLVEAETNLGRVQDILAELRPQARRLAAQAQQQATRETAGEELVRELLVAAHVRWHEAAARVAEAGARLATARGRRGSHDGGPHGRRRRSGRDRPRPRDAHLRCRRAAHGTRRGQRRPRRGSADRGAPGRRACGHGPRPGPARGEGLAAEADLALQRRIVAEPVPARDVDAEAELSAAERELADALAELAALGTARAAEGEAAGALKRAAAARAAELETARRRAADTTRRAEEERAGLDAVTGRPPRTNARPSRHARGSLRRSRPRPRSAPGGRRPGALSKAPRPSRTAPARPRPRARAWPRDLQARLTGLQARLDEDEARPIAQAVRRVGGKRVDAGLVVDPALRPAVETALGEIARAYQVERTAAAQVCGARAARSWWRRRRPRRTAQASKDGDGRAVAAATALGGGRLADAVRPGPARRGHALARHGRLGPDLPALLELQPDLPPGWLGVVRDGTIAAGPLDPDLRPGRWRRSSDGRAADSPDGARHGPGSGATDGGRARRQATRPQAARAALDGVADRRGSGRRGTPARRGRGADRRASPRGVGPRSGVAHGPARAPRSRRRPRPQRTWTPWTPTGTPTPRTRRAAPLWMRRPSPRGSVGRQSCVPGATGWPRPRPSGTASDGPPRIAGRAPRRSPPSTRSASRRPMGRSPRSSSASTRSAWSSMPRAAGSRRRGAAKRRPGPPWTSPRVADVTDRQRLTAAEAAATAARETLRAAETRSRSTEVADLEARLGLDAIREGLLVELAALGELGLRALASVVTGDDTAVAAWSAPGRRPLPSRPTRTPSRTSVPWRGPRIGGGLLVGVAAARRLRHRPAGWPPCGGATTSSAHRIRSRSTEYAEVRERLEAMESAGARPARGDRGHAAAHRGALGDGRRPVPTTFHALEGAFDARFQQLFGGGFARLSLTEPDDLASTGVEIVARPPGKKAQALAMLSGGERALTAVALLFAMLEVRPVPFCVLDEVDAALDEANVGRFAEALRSLADKTQFIVITHNRGTIETADALYGVTVGEDSVSRVVSLRLDEATAIADRAILDRVPVAG